jgi:hypothetical protein
VKFAAVKFTVAEPAAMKFSTVELAAADLGGHADVNAIRYADLVDDPTAAV